MQEVRLTDRMDEIDDFVDSGELGVLGETSDDDGGLGAVSIVETVNEPLCRRSPRNSCSRENGPASDRSEALADVVGDLGALYDPVAVLTVEVGDVLDRSGLIFDDRDNAMDNCDKVSEVYSYAWLTRAGRLTSFTSTTTSG